MAGPYYADRNLGNDANPGTIVAPKRELDSPGGLFSLGLQPGESGFAARDSVWPQQLIGIGNNGTASQHITLDEYGAGATRPTIDWQGSDAFGGDTFPIQQPNNYIDIRNWRIVNVGPSSGHSGIGSRAFSAENVYANTWFNCEVEQCSEDAFFSQRILGGDARIEGCLARRTGLRWLATGGNFPAAISCFRAPDVSGSSGSSSVIDCVVDRCAGEGVNFNELRFGVVQGGIVFSATSIGVYLDCVRDCHTERTLVSGTTDTAYHRSGYGNKVGPGIATVSEAYHGSTRGNLHGNNSRKLHFVAYCGAGSVIATDSTQVSHRYNEDQNTYVDNEDNFACWNVAGGVSFNGGSSRYNNASLVYTTGTSDQSDGNAMPSGINMNYTMWVGDLATRHASMIGANDPGSTFNLFKTTGWQSLSSITSLGAYTLVDGVVDADAQIAQFDPSALVTTIQALTSPALDALGVSGLANPGALKFGEDAPPIDTNQAIRVERHVVDFGASSDTASLTFTSAGKNAESVWPHLRNVRLASGGPAAGTSGSQSMATLGVHISNISAASCTLTRDSNGSNVDVRCYVEVWFYDGPSGGADEFIVRWSGTKAVTDTNLTATQSVSGVSDSGDLLVESLGAISNAAGPYAHAARLSLSGTTITFTRENSGGDTTYGAIAVEMTGSNWQVEIVPTHTFGAWNTTETETIGTITSWATAFIVSTLYVGDDENNESGWLVWPGSSATQVRFRMDSAGAAGSLGVANAFVVRNPNIVVDHYDTVTGGGSTFGTTTNPGAQTMAITAVPDLDYTGLVMHGIYDDDTFDGTPDGWFNYRLTDVDELEIWRSRGDVGTMKWAAQVIDFSALTFGAAGGGYRSGLFLFNYG